MNENRKDTIKRDRQKDDEVETATGQSNKPAIDASDAPDPDAHGSAAADVITDGEAGASTRNTGGAEPIKNMPEDYAKGKDAAKRGE
ncbi:hypothetical protein [Notoacmeibacter ruber]|uniref:Uncharacterized protein n=1 Tax=Notoacmeibacter ruber TaxID=2670375 RepID=A0A3L7JEA2_9HYPH|nr:hypothetical protein [Notoacmeibacter ruber]RLQ89097.1 hypothetical protein D8780_13455 [Notoacmeibacter ruber]